MIKLYLKKIPIYKPINLLLDKLFNEYDLYNNCKYSYQGDYETFQFVDNDNKKLYFSINIGLNIKYECRITFNYGTEYPSLNNKHYYTFFDKYIKTIEQVDLYSNIILIFISNKVYINEYILGGKKIGTDLSCCYFKDNNIQIYKESFNNFFVLPWNKKKIIKNEFIFEPWIKTEFTIDDLPTGAVLSDSGLCAKTTNKNKI